MSAAGAGAARPDEATVRRDRGARTEPCGREGTTEAELDRLCGTLFVGPLASWAGSLAFHEHPEAVAVDELGDRTFFDTLVTRFGRSHAGADRRAVASFWSQHYFSRLTIVLTAFCLIADRALPLDLAALRVRFCPDQGTPLSFHLRCGGPARAPDALVRALYEEQIAGTVAQLKCHSGLSARLLWENAGSYGMWILGEIARSRPSLAPVAAALLSDPRWPRAGCAMLPHLKGAALDGGVAVRRTCCLRHRLPGIGRCAGTCPLSEAGVGP